MDRRVLPALVVLLLAQCADGGDERAKTRDVDRRSVATATSTSTKPDGLQPSSTTTSTTTTTTIPFPTGPLAELPEPRTEVAGAPWRGKIVAIGGFIPGGATARADLYDPAANAWTPLPPLPVVIHHTSVVVFQDRAWVLGGYTLDAAGASIPLREVRSLGLGETSWRDEAPLTVARGALAAAATRSAILVGGGIDSAGKILTTTEIYTASSGKWTPGPSMATEREHFAMAAVGDDVYAIAGRAATFESNRTSVEFLRAGAKVWEAAPSLNRSRGGIGASTVGRTPCVAGGEESAGTVAPIECLRGGRWEIIGDLTTPRHGVAVVGLGEHLHVIGGGPQPGFTYSGVHEAFKI